MRLINGSEPVPRHHYPPRLGPISEYTCFVIRIYLCAAPSRSQNDIDIASSFIRGLSWLGWPLLDCRMNCRWFPFWQIDLLAFTFIFQLGRSYQHIHVFHNEAASIGQKARPTWLWRACGDIKFLLQFFINYALLTVMVAQWYPSKLLTRKIMRKEVGLFFIPVKLSGCTRNFEGWHLHGKNITTLWLTMTIFLFQVCQYKMGSTKST